MANLPAGIHVEQYDEYAKKFTQPWNQYLIERIHQEALTIVGQHKQMLDIGTGTAHTLIELAFSQLLSEWKFISVDYFDDMVKEAQQNVNFNGLNTRIAIRQGDVHQLDYPDNSLDLMFGRSVIHHWENPVKAYQEIYRVLSPGGVCIIHEPSREPSVEALQQFNDLRERFGIGEMTISEKFTVKEVEKQIEEANLLKYTTVTVGEGLAGLGFELKMVKPV